MLAGIVVSLLPRTERLHVAVARLEKPALIIVLIFAGAQLRLHFSLILIVPAIYAMLRYVALPVSTATFSRVVPQVVAVPRFGDGVVAQGAIAAAIAVNFAQVNPELTEVVLPVVLLGLVLSDISSIDGLPRLLSDAGEVGHAEPASAWVVEEAAE